MIVPCSNGGPQVCEIGDWKISLRPRVKIAQSPHSALRASWGDWLIFTHGLMGDFPVSNFTDLRISTVLFIDISYFEIAIITFRLFHNISLRQL